MDSVTQAVLGAGIQGALLGRSQGRRALLYGAVLATLPDLDVVVSYPDPVSAMTHHRGFSHSLFVLTAFAGLLCWTVRKRWPHAPYGAGRLFLALWLVLATHPLLDAFTSYGTQLWWPLPAVPASWSTIFIIDPVFTLPLLVTVLAAAVFGMGAAAGRAPAWALAFCGLYLAFTVAGKHLAESRARDALRAQGVAVDAVFSSPMPLNALLWRVVARSGDGYYEVVSGWLDRGPPESLRQPLNGELARALRDSPEHERLRWFTGGWLRYDAIGDELVVTDLRMGLPGFYTFRFVMARGAPDWRPVLPYRHPSSRGGMAELRAIGRRVLSQQPPLPLAEWAGRQLSPAREAGGPTP